GVPGLGNGGDLGDHGRVFHGLAGVGAGLHAEQPRVAPVEGDQLLVGALLDQLAMFQDYVTYQATARENIGLGSLDDLEDAQAIELAAQRGGADELVRGLPGEWGTMLGKWFDEGVNLSGGEWQKVALSRAFMRDVPILVLDEPTSALDAQAEYELFERLQQLTRGRTAVYISHRFSTVRRADRILFLEHGTLVEKGTHQELIALNGRYARLFRMQASAYTGEAMEDPAVVAEITAVP
ncbi:MAG: ATP-binding cassette domain-containing protein, partial [Candidatus Dormibacteraeota bacterium]|nr:ATP-binding cassette domain-containing protein [Candidatus Dormibacteraeota bacterium]